MQARAVTCPPLFIFVSANQDAHGCGDYQTRQHPIRRMELTVSTVVVLLFADLVLVIALLAAACSAKLVRLEGASYPAALRHAAATFGAVLALAAAVTAALGALCI